MMRLWGQSAQGARSPGEAGDVYRLLLQSMAEAVFLVDQHDVILYTNPAADRMFGYGEGELAGRHVAILNAYPEEESGRLIAEVDGIVREKGAWRGEFRNRTKDGREFLTASVISLVELEGRPCYLCVSQDITERRQAELALKDSEGRLDIATRASELGVWDWDRVNDTIVYSPRAKEIFGFPQKDLTIEAVRATIHPEDAAGTRAQSARALDPEIRDRPPYEYRIIRPDGEVRWVRAHGEAIFEEHQGEVMAVRYVGTVEDITGKRAAAERLGLLAAEVDHRAANLMSVVQAAVRLTKADSLEAYRKILNGRIGALANAHRLLSKSRWHGADLMSIVQEEMRPYGGEESSRVSIQGPAIALSAKAAQSISMAIHELSTNAAKYGALASGGTVDIRWRLSASRDLEFDWREKGAPAPAGPIKRGFGLKMIERSVEDQLGGRLELGGGTEGFSCAFSIPASNLAG